MANITKINLNGTSYDITDNTARSTANSANSKAESAQRAANTAQETAESALSGAWNISYNSEQTTLTFSKFLAKLGGMS